MALARRNARDAVVAEEAGKAVWEGRPVAWRAAWGGGPRGVAGRVGWRAGSGVGPGRVAGRVGWRAWSGSWQGLIAGRVGGWQGDRRWMDLRIK